MMAELAFILISSKLMNEYELRFFLQMYAFMIKWE
jgi:hypothetical protein